MISSERHALNCQIYRGLNRLNSLPAVKCWLTDICQSLNPSTQPHCFAKSKQNVANWRKKEQLILVDDKICFHSRVLITGGREKAYLHAQSGFFPAVNSLAFTYSVILLLQSFFKGRFFFPV